MRTTQTMTVSLPPGMVRTFEKVRKAESRTRSELVREALRHYFDARFRTVEPSKAELLAIRRGRAEIARGRYVSIEQLRDDLAAPHRKTRSKTARKASG